MTSKWTATCIGCHRPNALILTEARRHDPVTVGCRHRCQEPAALAAMLATDPDVLEAQAEARRWQATAKWAVDFARRTVAA
jgi:hypothetical protein